MINKLRSRVIILMLVAIVASIILVSVIMNVTLFNKFDEYMESEQQDKINEIIALIKKSYDEENGWTEEGLQYIANSSLARDFDITIRDSDGNIVYQSQMTNSMMENHMDMMNRMGHNMMGMSTGDYTGSKDYKTEKYNISALNKKVGTLELGYMGPFTITESEIEFTKSINNSIIYSSVFSIIIAVLLGIYFSKIISKPVLKINRASNDIRKGKLNIRIDEDSKIIEFKELSNSINHLALSLQEQQKLRKRLTTDISHELRTPLTVLNSHIEAMLDGIWEPSKERLSIFKGEVDRLINLVEELKYLVDIENHKIELQKREVDISYIIKEVLDRFRLEFNKKEINLESDLETNITISADPDKINQILINLISNAIKFTRKGDTIRVKANSTNSNIILEVEDTGIGINKEDLPYIFKRLYRGDMSRNRDTGGSGIGLTITEKLVQAHNGIIEVISEKNKGTKFIITLPKGNNNLGGDNK
ncbi:MAG: HAMP domain-containing histidine kinase [Firmicutes bacterium]|nr:HAMP domain-containing histidine kinase [Bacillota bacterium]